MRKGRFKEKVVIVSGGGTGIGKACAMAFADEGAKVVIAARREAPLQEVVKVIEARGGVASLMKTDITKSAQVRNLVEKTVTLHGKVDVLVANAGVGIYAPITESSDKDVDKIIDINVKGTFYQLREAAKQMLKQGYGSIVVTSSISGLFGDVDSTLYCCSKGAVSNLVRALSQELAAKNIRVNAVCPGSIGGEGMCADYIEDSEDPEEFLRQENEEVPMKRIGNLHEVAAVALFLASDDASYVTGANYLCDGGMAAGR